MKPAKLRNNLIQIGCYAAILFFVLGASFFSLARQAKADTLGQDQAFFISPQYDLQSRSSVNATLREISGHAYFYVEDGYWDSVNQDMQNQVTDRLNALAQEFDSRIYPIERQFFGSERNPGINGDTRVTFLLSPLLENAGGYYDTANEYSRQEVANSNEREMAYLNIGQLADQRKAFTFLAHEFQHLISFNQKEVLRKVSDDTWLNELRSEYAVTLLGYNDVFTGSNLEQRLQSFLNNPADSLTEWRNLPADYGQITLFGEYIAEHWSPNVIADTSSNASIGIASINEALAKNGFTDSFNDVFADWLIANILNDTSTNPKFGYNRDSLKDFHINPSKALLNLGDNITFAISDSIKDWQGRWYDVSEFLPGQNNFIKIKFSSPSLTSFYIPYIIFKTDGSEVVSSFNSSYSSDTLYVGEIGKDISRFIFMPIKKDKISGFGSDETPVSFTFSLDREQSAPQELLAPLTMAAPSSASQQNNPQTPVPTPVVIPDGSLIRAIGDYKVYVIEGHWKRHIISSRIFSFYPQFGFDKVKEVDSSVLAQYQESNLIRYESGKRVYSEDESGVKHWLNITAAQFTASGRSWDSIFPVNLAELNFYRTGVNMTK